MADAMTEVGLTAQIAEAEAHLAELRRRAAAATTCAELGCDMQFMGGCSVGCCDECSCSTSVHVCSRCGDSDYGDPVEAAEVRAQCEMTGSGNLSVRV
jgi:hypothetical protein